MPNWFPHNPIHLLIIIPIALVTIRKNLAMNQELTVPGAVQTQDIKISPRHSELAAKVNGGCKKVLVNRSNLPGCGQVVGAHQ